MVRYNRAWLRDRLLACFIGKNIGGTVGAPYEGCGEMLDVKGFTTPPGEPEPDDDLDLQLIWLVALEKFGAHALDAAYLGEMWLSMIPPDPNEYGVPLTLTTKATGCTQLPMTHAYGSGNHRGIGPAEMAYAIRAGRVPRTEEMPVHVLEAAQGICRSGETGSIYRMTTRCGRPAPLPAGYTENPELSLSISD